MTKGADLKRRADALSDARKRLLRMRLEELAPSSAVRSAGGHLVAVIVGSESADPTELRQYCESKLPPYMVPQSFRTIDDLPKTPAGKLDRRALHQRSRPTGDGGGSDIAAPRNSTERKLVAIWAEVLGVSDLSIHDDFFEIGGDSLLTIRILSRALREGISIAPDTFFANPTIAQQAQLVEQVQTSPKDTGPVSGALSLTPIQRWFFRHIPTDPHHWNQSLLFTLRSEVRSEHLTRAVEQLLRQHDALRSSFSCDSGVWSGYVHEAVENPVRIVDISEGGADALAASIRDLAAEMNADFDLGVAPLLRVAHFLTGPDCPDRLLIVAHHLIVDNLSWQILISDIEAFLEQARRGDSVEAQTGTTPFQTWASRLNAYANSRSIEAGRSYWQNTLPDRVPDIPTDGPIAVNTEAHSKIARCTLGQEATEALTRDTQKKLRASMESLLLSALARSISHWSGDPSVLLDVEGHGREALFDDVDITHTVGWFTTVYPVFFNAPDHKVWSAAGSALRFVKESLQAIPRNGIDFGLLTELERAAPDNRLKRYGGAHILFNYLGQIVPAAGEGLLTLVDATCGAPRSGRCERPYLIEINARIDEGRLVADFSYDDSTHAAKTIDRFGRQFIMFLTELADSVNWSGESTLVAADFPLADLSQKEFESLSSQLDALDDD